VRFLAGIFLLCTLVLSVSVLNAAGPQPAPALVCCVAFSPDGRLVLTSGDRHLGGCGMWPAAKNCGSCKIAGRN